MSIDTDTSNVVFSASSAAHELKSTPRKQLVFESFIEISVQNTKLEILFSLSRYFQYSILFPQIASTHYSLLCSQWCRLLRRVSLRTDIHHECRKCWYLSLLYNDELWRSHVAEIDLCKINNGGCDHKCLNYDGQIVCQCREGYRLLDDQSNCEGKPRIHSQYIVPTHLMLVRLPSSLRSRGQINYKQ